MLRTTEQFLKVDGYLGSGDYIQSPNLLFFAVMQDDGNFCVYRGTGPQCEKKCLWASNTMRPGGQFFAVMQRDGNFCVYPGTQPGNATGGALWWASNTALPVGQFFANMQDDGNFCVYNGTGPNDSHGCVWATMKTIYMDANTKSQFDIMTTKTKELFRDVIGMGLADCSPNLRLAYYQPVVFGLKRLVGADSSPAKSLSDELSNRFFWILKSYWMSTGGLPGKSESETIDKFMKVVELIKGRMVEQQTGAHLCSAKIEDHVIASVAVLLDVGSQDYVGLASDQLLSFDAVVFRPKEVHRDVALAHSDETPRLKYFKVNWFD